MRRPAEGLLLVLLSGVVYGLMPGVVTYCYRQRANATIMVVIRYAAVSLLVSFWALRPQNSFALFRKKWKKILCLSLVNAATPTLLYSAYAHLAMGMVT